MHILLWISFCLGCLLLGNTVWAFESPNLSLKNQGLIIADEVKTLKLFRDQSPAEIRSLATRLGKKYQKVILHLGRKKVFQRGGLFFYDTSQRNLKIFAQTLKEEQTELYLWFLDSFGSDAFSAIYQEYPAILKQTLKDIQALDLPHTGYMLDLEWINHPAGENHQAYLKLLSDFKAAIGQKKLYAFAPLIDDLLENQKRGYDEIEMRKYLDGILAPIYVKDGGFLVQDGSLWLQLNSRRISQLRDFHQKQGYLTVVSLEGGLIIVRNQGQLYFVRALRSAEHPIMQNLTPLNAQSSLFLETATYQAKQNFELVKNDGESEVIQAGEVLYFFHVKENILRPGDLIWEYFVIQEP